MATQLTAFPQTIRWPDRRAAALWVVAILIISVLVWLRPTKNTVYPVYSLAGHGWYHGENSYLQNISPFDGYYYSPAATLVFAALAVLPERLEPVVWRLLGGVLFIVGFALASRTLDWNWNERTVQQRHWAWVLLLPMAIGNLHNGQANIHLAGVMLFAVFAAGQARWMICAALLALACLFKIYHIATALLLVVMFPWQLGWRLPLAVAVGLGLPFLTQSTPYVLSEYREWLHSLMGNDRFIETTGPGCRDLSLLLYRVGLPMNRSNFAVIQLAAAAAAALTCLNAKWRLRWSDDRLIRLGYFLGTSWIMLCGPATESATYVLLAPMVALLAITALFNPMPTAARIFILAGCALVQSALLAPMFPFGRAYHDFGPHPLGTLLMLIGYLAWEFRSAAPRAAN